MFEHLITKRVARCLSQNSTLVICRYSHTRRTHYDTLNLKQNCSNDDVRHSFAKLSKLYHPDTSKTGSSEQNSRKFQEIMEAYRILNKQSTRDAYDAQLTHTNFDSNDIPHYGRPFRYGDYEMIRRYRANDPYANTRYSQWGPNSYGPFGNKETYDAWNTQSMFNRKRLLTFLVIYVVVSSMSVYMLYMGTQRNRIAMKDIQAQYALRYGAHGPRYYGPVQRPNDLTPPEAPKQN